VTPSALLLLGALAALPAGQVSTPHFELRFDEAERGPAEALAATAEAERDDLCEDLGGCPDGPKLVIVVASDSDALRRYLGPGVPSWAAGIAIPRDSIAGVHLSPAGGTRWGDLRTTFRHELSHLLVHQVVGGHPLPRWLKEGFATHQAREWSFERVKVLTRAAMTRGLLPLDDIDRRFPRSHHEVSLAYAQGVAFVAFLLREDAEAFAAVLRGVRDGRPYREALELAYGRPLAQLEADWSAAMNHEYRFVPLLTGGSTLWVMITLLFLLGYWRRRRERRETLARWELEELARRPHGL
jgi:hypothetical protein